MYTPARRNKKRAQRQEGVVLLIVLLIVTMTTGTALFAMNATSSEQRIAGQYSEGAWTLSVAEGAAMLGMAAQEQGTLGVDQRWVGANAPFTLRYGVRASPLSRTFDTAQDAVRLTLAQFPANTEGFVPQALRTGDANHPAFARTQRTVEGRVLATVWEADDLSRVVTRTEVTGFGETRLPVDPTDLVGTTGQRGRHTTVAMVRGYVDTVTARQVVQ